MAQKPKSDPGMEGLPPTSINPEVAWRHIRNGLVGGLVAGTVAYLVDYHRVQLPAWLSDLKG